MASASLAATVMAESAGAGGPGTDGRFSEVCARLLEAAKTDNEIVSELCHVANGRNAGSGLGDSELEGGDGSARAASGDSGSHSATAEFFAALLKQHRVLATHSDGSNDGSCFDRDSESDSATESTESCTESDVPAIRWSTDHCGLLVPLALAVAVAHYGVQLPAKVKAVGGCYLVLQWEFPMPVAADRRRHLATFVRLSCELAGDDAVMMRASHGLRNQDGSLTNSMLRKSSTLADAAGAVARFMLRFGVWLRLADRDISAAASESKLFSAVDVLLDRSNLEEPWIDNVRSQAFGVGTDAFSRAVHLFVGFMQDQGVIKPRAATTGDTFVLSWAVAGIEFELRAKDWLLSCTVQPPKTDKHGRAGSSITDGSHDLSVLKVGFSSLHDPFMASVTVRYWLSLLAHFQFCTHSSIDHAAGPVDFKTFELMQATGVYVPVDGAMFQDVFALRQCCRALFAICRSESHFLAGKCYAARTTVAKSAPQFIKDLIDGVQRKGGTLKYESNAQAVCRLVGEKPGFVLEDPVFRLVVQIVLRISGRFAASFPGHVLLPALDRRPLLDGELEEDDSCVFDVSLWCSMGKQRPRYKSFGVSPRAYPVRFRVQMPNRVSVSTFSFTTGGRTELYDNLADDVHKIEDVVDEALVALRQFVSECDSRARSLPSFALDETGIAWNCDFLCNTYTATGSCPFSGSAVGGAFVGDGAPASVEYQCDYLHAHIAVMGTRFDVSRCQAPAEIDDSRLCCPVCLEPLLQLVSYRDCCDAFIRFTKPLVLTECGHTYHRECFEALQNVSIIDYARGCKHGDESKVRDGTGVAELYPKFKCPVCAFPAPRCVAVSRVLPQKFVPHYVFRKVTERCQATENTGCIFKAHDLPCPWGTSLVDNAPTGHLPFCTFSEADKDFQSCLRTAGCTYSHEEPSVTRLQGLPCFLRQQRIISKGVRDLEGRKRSVLSAVESDAEQMKTIEACLKQQRATDGNEASVSPTGSPPARIVFEKKILFEIIVCANVVLMFESEPLNGEHASDALPFKATVSGSYSDLTTGSSTSETFRQRACGMPAGWVDAED